MLLNDTSFNESEIDSLKTNTIIVLIYDSIDQSDSVGVSATYKVTLNDSIDISETPEIDLKEYFSLNDIKMPHPNELSDRITENGNLHQTPLGNKVWDVSSRNKIFNINYTNVDLNDAVWQDFYDLYLDHVNNGTDVYCESTEMDINNYVSINISPPDYIAGTENLFNITINLTVLND